SASAATSSGGRGSVTAAHGSAPAAWIPVQARLASQAASAASHSAPGSASAAAASATSVAGTSTKLKYGIAIRFAMGETTDISPKYAAPMGASPKLIVSCRAASDATTRVIR